MNKYDSYLPRFTADFSTAKNTRSTISETAKRGIHLIPQQQSCGDCKRQCEDNYRQEKDVCRLLYQETPQLERNCNRIAEDRKVRCINNTCWFCYVA